ncbi:unnamed protein product [Rotaria magnacalcarata]|uniref:Uncharacterized protein n=2 Tax=Rotaria magnacalcarata TaxID=392030 RepID=A0A816YW35_9BILA|nr:unnamed protein product [Rotaria magnacalcarata]CAF1557412.1 unnamed protein product [Rotaria magnacalcarata]CAF2138502.1 unnamed protein product [Rotaria magnacalcarata]CAF2180944.1 unnamed protein product [Rotaria magnacalcarata]CAF3827281.1 unnamed protein product [Rotaria magnacalcarata]
MGLITYNPWTKEHPSRYLYLTVVLVVILNCVFGVLRIPQRIPSFDIPTIRAFVGLKHKPYKLWEAFTTFPFKSVHPELQEDTATSSSAAAVFTVRLTAIFS